MVESNYDLSNLVEVELVDDEAFHKVRETLTRMGIANNKKYTLTQTCGILKKMGKYYIVHFKEMFALDGKESTFDDKDRQRRNLIAHLLDEWGLVKIVNPDQVEDRLEIGQLKVVKFDEKDQWELQEKYKIGRKQGYRRSAA